MTRQLQARATQARQQLQQTAENKEVRWSFHIVRGLVADELLVATPATDLLVLGRVSRPRDRFFHSSWLVYIIFFAIELLHPWP